MFDVLTDRAYRHLFLAQVIALVGTGLATVALGLLAFDLAGPEAGAVLGTALAIKMIAYIGVAPIAAAFTEHLPRRTILVSTVKLPQAMPQIRRSIYQRTTRGLWIFLATPRLRGLLSLNLAVAAASAMVVVNSVVLVQSRFALPQRFTAFALAAFGAGSMLTALLLPRLLKSLPDRTALLGGAGVLVACLAAGVYLRSYSVLLGLWFILGIGYCLVQTPGGRLLRRSAHAEDRPALFAAQFALSHGCWLITYPLAGWVGAQVGLTASFIALAGVAAIALVIAIAVWRPSHEQAVMVHIHEHLAADHPHLHSGQGRTHRHEYIIDDLHRAWPAMAAQYSR